MSVEYASGRRADVYGDADAPTVLMWHGRGPDQRASLAVLAEAVAARGRRVVVPDWDSSSADHGRADLLTSLRFARESATHDPGEVVLVGWSLGGTAALSLTQHQRRLGLSLPRVVVVAAGIVTDDPLTGVDLTPPPPRPAPVTTRLDLICGRHDDRATVDGVAAAHDLWRAAGWDATLTVLDADHDTIVVATAEPVAEVVCRQDR